MLSHPRGDFSTHYACPCWPPPATPCSASPPATSTTTPTACTNWPRSTSRPRSRRCAPAAPTRSCCWATRAAARSWPRPRPPPNATAAPRRRLHRAGRPPGRGRLHAPGHRPVGHRRGRPVLVRPGARHVRPRQRVATLPRGVALRPRLGGRLSPRPAGAGSPASTPSPGRPSPTTRVHRIKAPRPPATRGPRHLEPAAPAGGARPLPHHLPHARRPRPPRPRHRLPGSNPTTGSTPAGPRARSSPSPTRSTPTTARSASAGS